MKMKYIAFFEYRMEDFEKCLEKRNESIKMRGKNPEKYFKVLYPVMLMEGGETGFAIIEASDEEQLTNTILHYGSLMKWNFVPVYDLEAVIEKFEAMKKA
jgi:hypothetical protein